MATEFFADTLGSRHKATDSDGSVVERFELCPELSAVPTAEALLAARVSRFSGFSHPGFAALRRVERLHQPERIRIVSAAVTGTRLSAVLRRAHDRGVPPPPGVVRNLARQIVRAMAEFHLALPDLSHGTLAPERVILADDGRAVIVEPVLVPVLEWFRLGRTELWSRFGIPVPPTAGMARFDHVTDVMQLGLVVLAIAIGRPIAREEYPHEVERLVNTSGAPADGRPPLVSPAMRSWLLRASPQAQMRVAFRSAVDAAAAFDEVDAEVPRHKTLVSAVVAWLDAVGTGPAAPPAGRPTGPDRLAAPPSSAVAFRF